MNYGFSTDELRVLRECNMESFYQRSLPIGVGMGVATWLAVQKVRINYAIRRKIILMSLFSKRAF